MFHIQVSAAHAMKDILSLLFYTLCYIIEILVGISIFFLNIAYVTVITKHSNGEKIKEIGLVGFVYSLQTYTHTIFSSLCIV